MKNALSISIDISSKAPIYEQIAGEIRALLVAGELAPGAQLPTVRQLAMDLNVHHNTVANAYRILAEEGWLELRRGRGVRVVSRSKGQRATRWGRGRHNAFRSELKRLLAKAAAEGLPPETIARQLSLYARHVRNWVPAR
jgi:GntR family transcriptional regulator